MVVDSSGTDRFSAESMILGEWRCIELVLSVGAAGHVTVLSNGVPMLYFADQTLNGHGYDMVQVGVMRNPATANDDFFIDDLAVATFPIGCE